MTLNEYFYGVYVSHETDKHERYDFQTDTISVNYWLDESFWTRQHLFRAEWEPPLEDGSGGYINWFIDGEFVAGISGTELQRVSQTEIPSEPMYLLLNLAVSKDWSFPDAWYLGCEYKCWSCFDPNCQCALPKGYCDSFPADFQIDHVRVYQAKKERRHTLGCSPAGHPTADFIRQHKRRYKIKGQKLPLRPIQQGGASCTSRGDCGHGICTRSLGLPGHNGMICRCLEGWTGPNCLAHRAANPRTRDTFSTYALAFLLFVSFVSIIAFFGYFLWNRRYSERVLYDLLSDIETEKALSRTTTPPVASSSESMAPNPSTLISQSYQKGP